MGSHGGHEVDASAHTHAGGHARTSHGDHAARFRDRFWWSLVLSVPVIAFSSMFADLVGYTRPANTGWVSPVFGTIVFCYGGEPFLSGAVAELRARRPGMMLLIGQAITVAYVASLFTSLHATGVDLDFWWELALLIDVMLLGHWVEMRAVGQAQGALAALAALLPDEAERVAASGEIETVALNALGVGDVVLVRAGGRVPADGLVDDGEAELDESMVTGESHAVVKRPGDKVVAGTVSTDSSIRVRITAVGDDTALAGIQRLVDEAQSSRSRAQTLADRAAAVLFYVATGSAIVTFFVWVALGDTNRAVESAVTVLVIACPHALGLAIPLVTAISSSLAARAGILVKEQLALERMRTVTAVLFDKTGTLTTGRHAVTGVAALTLSHDELLALAAAAEGESEHPVARAIVEAAPGTIPRAERFRSLTGRGVEAIVDGHDIAVGGPALLRERGIIEPDGLTSATSVWRDRGASVLYIICDEAIVGAVALEDAVRAESDEAVRALHELGLRVVMVTGDAKQVADDVAHRLGIDEVFAEVLPSDKDHVVSELQGRGLRVAMVGDGVNDAPALARADVGIAIGAGTDVAIESAGVVLASSDPRSVVSVIDLSKAAYRKMVQNLVWATGYNVGAIPLAAGVLAWAGVTLAPAAGAALMSASTVIVAFNAQTLRRLDLRPRGDAQSTAPGETRPRSSVTGVPSHP